MSKKELYAYHGYAVTMDGEIINAAGRHLKISDDGHVWLQIKGKKCRRIAGRVVYEAITRESLGNAYVLIFLDGDCTNTAFTNLSAVKRSTYFLNHDWQDMKMFSHEQQEHIRRDYKKGIGKKQLAKHYGCCVQTIKKVVDGKY